MDIEEAELQRLKQELEDDLKAVRRVQEIFAKRHPEGPKFCDNAARGRDEPQHPRGQPPPEKGTLRQGVIDIIKKAGPSGCRPRDIVAALEAAGYPFKNHDVAASIVGTALRRLTHRDHLVEKTVTGKYTWRGPAA